MSRSRLIPLLAVVGLAAVAPTASAAINPWRETRPLNIAHQGGEDEFPSNTMYAFKKAVKAGADMLELDVTVTKDDQVVVRHDTTLDAKSNGTGNVSDQTLAQIRGLDAAYWFSPTGRHYAHDHPVADYVFRGVATGKRRPPKGFTAADFRIPTLREVLRAFPRTRINIEVKGRTPKEDLSEYVYNAGVLAKFLKPYRKRKDIIVVSFKQPAVERFHQLAPSFPLAPGVDGITSFLLAGGSPGAGIKVFQMPITYKFGGSRLTVTTQEFVDKVHAAGYAWQNWFDDPDPDAPSSWATLVNLCVDGVMTSRPAAFERFLKTARSPARCSVGR